MARFRVPRARSVPAPWFAGAAGYVGQPRAEEPVLDAADRGRLQFLPERPVTQHRTGTEQPFDHGERTGDVTVAEPLLVVSIWLVAITWKTPVISGAR